MLRVALTGGAASGKSAAAAMFRELGAYVSQSDEIGRAMMQPGQAVYHAIVQQFGPGVVLADGALDRRALARLAFEGNRLDDLNAIVHPAVIAAQADWMRGIEAQHPGAIAIVESALVLETRFGPEDADNSAARMPWRSRFDRIVLVSTMEKTRLDRYVRRVLASDPAAHPDEVRADARSRFAVQMPDTEKRALADPIIENEGTLQDLRRRVVEVYDRLQTEILEACTSEM